MQITFGDLVRVRATPETKAAGIAGLEATCTGFTQPSSSQVDVFGELQDDYALSIMFEESSDQLWLDPGLLEFIDHGAGMEIGLDGVDKKWTRTADGDWIEEQTGTKKRPWWKFW